MPYSLCLGLSESSSAGIGVPAYLPAATVLTIEGKHELEMRLLTLENLVQLACVR